MAQDAGREGHHEELGNPRPAERQTAPSGTMGWDQFKEAISRPGGGVAFLMRCRRILRTCAESVRLPDQGSVITAMTFMGL